MNLHGTKTLKITITQAEYWKLLKRSVEIGINHHHIVGDFIADLTHGTHGQKAYDLANEYFDAAWKKRKIAEYNAEDLRVIANLDKKIEVDRKGHMGGFEYPPTLVDDGRELAGRGCKTKNKKDDGKLPERN